MSKTNEAFGDHDTIEDTGLDTVTGAFYSVEHGAVTGGKGNGSGSWLEALATEMGQAMNSRL